MAGGIADFIYVVSISGIQIDSTVSSNSSYDVTNLVVGTYDVVVYDVNGCSSNTNITINQPTELIISDSIINIDCYNGNTGSILVSATGGTPTYTYSWNPTSTDSVLTNLSAGYYSVTVADYNACIKMIDNIQITEPTELMLSLDNVVDLTCNNDSTGSISVSATGGTPSYTYLWNNGETTANITGINAGTYTVSISDNNLCSDTIIVTVNEPSQMALSDSSYIENYYGAIALTVIGGTPDYAFLWNTGQISDMVSGLYAGDYTVTVTDANGCTVENYYKVDVELIIPSVITPNGDGKNDKFRIVNINAFEEADIKIFNRWGDVIFDYAGTGIGYEDESKQWDGTFNGKELPVGSFVYIIDLKNDDDPYTGTVTIVR
jgi:gliding motility-associated-like protein